MAKLLGILGGLGPLSSAYLYRLITEHTRAECDQDHIDIVINSRATTPDRTAYILGRSSDSPVDAMVEDARRLEAYGADAIVIACNTAHYFIDAVRDAVNVPVPSLIEKTADFIRYSDFKRAGILATEGTVSSGAYQDKLSRNGVGYVTPSERSQAILTELIYDCVKSGKPGAGEKLDAVIGEFIDAGCDCLILGCTELSVLADELSMKDGAHFPAIIDSLDVICAYAVNLCGKDTVGLSPTLEFWAKNIFAGGEWQ